MLTAGPVSKMASQQKKAFCVFHFEVSRFVITVQREFWAWFRKDARMRNLDSCRCWQCMLCSCKVRNKFVNFWNHTILLCIPCIIWRTAIYSKLWLGFHLILRYFTCYITFWYHQASCWCVTKQDRSLNNTPVLHLRSNHCQLAGFSLYKCEWIDPSLRPGLIL